MNLEKKQNQAICAEIGQQLRTSLSREQASVPHRLRQLLHRLEEADRRLAARFSPSSASDMPPDISHYFASADQTFQAAKVAKPTTKARILPPEEIFLGLAVAGIVLLFEIAVLVLLAD